MEDMANVFPWLNSFSDETPIIPLEKLEGAERQGGNLACPLGSVPLGIFPWVYILVLVLVPAPPPYCIFDHHTQVMDAVFIA